MTLFQKVSMQCREVEPPGKAWLLDASHLLFKIVLLQVICSCNQDIIYTLIRFWLCFGFGLLNKWSTGLLLAVSVVARRTAAAFHVRFPIFAHSSDSIHHPSVVYFSKQFFLIFISIFFLIYLTWKIFEKNKQFVLIMLFAS